MKRRLQELEHSIARYLAQLDDAEAQEPATAEASSQRLQEKIAALNEQMQALKALEAELRAAPDHQISLTDPDARSMMSRGVGVVGYNVQTAVEPEHHLIVAHDVVNTGSVGAHGRAGPRQATHAVADCGDDTGEEILACEQSGITTLVPKAKTSNTGARGLFSRDRFRYDPQANAYRCPAGETLTGRFRNVEAGCTLDAYWSSACPRCPLKAQCTPASQRRIRRWEHEAVLEAVQARLDAEPQSMRLRRQTVAHPFGTIKSWMGYTHFLTSSPARSRGCARR